MTIQDIESLFNVLDKARGWPELRHIHDQVLEQLRRAQLDTVVNIIPVTIVGPVEMKEAPKETKK